jgi:TonB family protein
MVSWIIEPAISLSLFYLAYLLFLRKLPFFRANRYYLLTAILFSLILPHINFSPPVTFASYSYFIPEVTISQSPDAQENITTGSGWPVFRFILVVYLVVVLLLSARLLFRMLQIYNLAAGNRTMKYKNAHIVSLDSELAPFSFLNYIFINDTLYSKKEREKIIEHELVHINQHHSIDLIILEILTIIQWFNPVAWLCRRSMIEIHEYLADEAVIREGTNIPFYQEMLMNLQLGREYFSPTSNFNKSLTLNRIKMMTTLKPASWKRIRFFILLPLLTILALMCTKSIYDMDELPEPVKSNTVTDEGVFGYDPKGGESGEETGEVFFVVEEMPDFQGGGQMAFREYIAENLSYPEAAMKDSISGRVFVQFIVNENGVVSKAEIVRGIHPLLDEEALRVVRSSPDWIPGRQRGVPVNVAFTFPISFVLDAQEENSPGSGEA